MFSKINRKIAGVLVAAGLLAGVTAAAPAQAETAGCSSGAYPGYCGTLTDLESPTALSFDSYRQASAVNNHVIGYYDSDGDDATDMLVLPDAASLGASGTVMVEYAPNGVASDLCVSEPYQLAGLVLRVCNGSAWQRFAEKPVYVPAAPQTGWTANSSDAVDGSAAVAFVLVNKETGNIVSANGLRGQLTGVTDPGTASPVSNYTGQEVFAFDFAT